MKMLRKEELNPDLEPDWIIFRTDRRTSLLDKVIPSKYERILKTILLSHPYEKTILMISFFKEFFEFLKERKKYWLLPILLVLGLFGFIIVLSQGSPVATFIYAIF